MVEAFLTNEVFLSIEIKLSLLTVLQQDFITIIKFSDEHLIRVVEVCVSRREVMQSPETHLCKIV